MIRRRRRIVYLTSTIQFLIMISNVHLAWTKSTIPGVGVGIDVGNGIRFHIYISFLYLYFPNHRMNLFCIGYDKRYRSKACFSDTLAHAPKVYKKSSRPNAQYLQILGLSFKLTS